MTRPPVTCEPFRVPTEQLVDAIADVLTEYVEEARSDKRTERKGATA